MGRALGTSYEANVTPGHLSPKSNACGRKGGAVPTMSPERCSLNELSKNSWPVSGNTVTRSLLNAPSRFGKKYLWPAMVASNVNTDGSTD